MASQPNSANAPAEKETFAILDTESGDYLNSAANMAEAEDIARAAIAADPKLRISIYQVVKVMAAVHKIEPVWTARG